VARAPSVITVMINIFLGAGKNPMANLSDVTYINIFAPKDDPASDL